MAAAEPSDSDLVQTARKGDQSAWDALVRRHAGRIWAVARGHRLSLADAEDVVQVTFLKLVTHLDSLRQPDRVGAWLATTARHECLGIIRRAGRTMPTGEDETLDGPDRNAAPVDTAVLVAERHSALLAALERLSDKCRRLLRVLMADPEPTYAEVGAALDIPIGSIGPARGRCLQHLRRHLGGITGPGDDSQPV